MENNGKIRGKSDEAITLSDESAPSWLGELKTGNRQAFERLWNYYFAQVVRLAKVKLRGLALLTADEEDVALSAFDSFYRAVSHGAFRQLETHGDLWQILISLTTRKAIDYRRRQQAQRRGGPPSSLAVATSNDGLLEGLLSRERDPQFQALVSDEFTALLDSLKDDQMRQIALHKLEGYTNEEVAERIECSVRTIERRLEMIRRRWSEAIPN